VSAPPPAPRSGPAGRWLEWLEQRINVTEIFSFLSHFGLVYTPVDVSRPMREVLHDVATRPVSSYMRWPRSLGLITAVLFGLEAITGVLLACYYQPTPEAAFPSTRMIARDLPFGWFVHQVHTWGAYLLIGALTVRLLRLFWDGLYRAPREVLWWSAVAMAWIAVQADFTGRLLPWDSHSYWSVVRGLEVIAAQPIIGPVLTFLVGGRIVNQDVLIRFYVLHVLVLPAMFLVFFYLTFATLRRVGLSPSEGEDPARPQVTTFRDHLFSVVTLYVLIFGVLVSLAVLLPLPFRGQADPYVTPAGARPPWYLLAPYALIEGIPIPGWIMGSALAIASLAVLLLPLWVKRWDHPEGERRLRLGGLLAFALWVALAVLGSFMDRSR
jgi:quinol-cytochrome oxidoreductase complex cytochrome b subunit